MTTTPSAPNQQADSGSEKGPALSGLEALRRNLAKGGPRSPISELMDFHSVEFDDGKAQMQGNPGHKHYNPIGIVHGGFAATLLDAAMWSAVHTTLPAGMASTTLELKINYLRPMTVDTGPVLCEGKVISRGKRTALAEASIRDRAGKLYAHGTSTLLLMGAPGEG
ncbi:PaaI family thioesterase [Phenylobacterium sp.]|uniref:PaaI family thioesterase n=1 Tax=Phenylobacterium sp. TaxID=1871053 RepID=UPI002FC9ABE5